VSPCRILRAFPVQELPGEGGSIDVEMDPVDEASTRAAIRDQYGMQYVVQSHLEFRLLLRRFQSFGWRWIPWTRPTRALRSATSTA